MADMKPSMDFSRSQNDVLLYVRADARLCCLPKMIELGHNYFIPLCYHLGASGYNFRPRQGVRGNKVALFCNEYYCSLCKYYRSAGLDVVSTKCAVAVTESVDIHLMPVA